MTSNTLHCHICQAVLDDNKSTVKQHISSVHLSYRPYECINCKNKGDIFNTATVEAMDVHISTSHCATNSEEYRVIKDKTKEAELTAAIEECRRLSTLKLPAADTAVVSRLNPAPNGPADSADDARVPCDLKENLRQVYVLPGNSSANSENLTSTVLKPENTTTTGNAVQSENEIIQIDDDDEQTEVKQEHGQTSRNVVRSEIEIIQIDDDDEQTEVKQEHGQEDNSLAISIDDGQNQQQLRFDESSGKSATDDDEESEYSFENESDCEILTCKTRSHGSKKENCRKSIKDKGQSNSVQTRTHAREKPFKCERCNYAATHRYILNRHERTHSGEKPYKCRFCKFAAAQSSHLIRHVRIHSGEKPFKCRICKFETAQSNDLIRHNRIHSGEKPFKCRFCKYATAERGNLIRHNRFHSGEKPFKCRFCKYATAERGNLIRHNRSHIGDNCQYMSRHNDSLNRHVKIQHKSTLKISATNSMKNTERNVLKKSGL